MQSSVGLLFILGLSFCLSGFSARPHVRRDEVSLQNGMDAIAFNARFKTLSPYSPCEGNEEACVGSSHAQCNQGYFTRTPCGPGLVCRASPIMGSLGITIGCITENENTRRILATGVEYTPPTQPDSSQTSLSLDAAVISSGFRDDGVDDGVTPGQAPSRTSSNNWINFCNTVNKPLTDGNQHAEGSCNNAPIGVIPSVDNMPSAKIVSPRNLAIFPRNQNITVQVVINNLESGWFTHADKTYMSSPQEVNMNGDVMGHSHIVVDELIGGFDQMTPTDPRTPRFFMGLNAPPVNSVLSTVVSGLTAGYYRVAVFHSGANHQPIALPVAQRGATGDMIYFSVV